jgi:hypothetical protein
MAFIGNVNDPEQRHNCIPFIYPYENKWYTFIQASIDIKADSELILPHISAI